MGFERALALLDEVQHPAQLDGFAAAGFSSALETTRAGTTFDELTSQVDGLRGLFDDVDRFAQKCMRIRLVHSTDPMTPQFRTLLHSTIVSYERDLPLLRGRVAAALSRIDRSVAREATDRVMASAEGVLALREELRQGILRAAERLAAAWLPEAQRAARDRALPDPDRQRWGRARVDLEQLSARGDLLATGNLAQRLERIEPPAEEPEEPSDKRFSLLEID